MSSRSLARKSVWACPGRARGWVHEAARVPVVHGDANVCSAQLPRSACTVYMIYSQTPLFRGFWEEKFRPLKPRNRGVRETRGSLVFTVMTQTTDLNGNRSCDNASLHYKTSQYASIYSLKIFYQSKTILEVTKVPQNSLKLVRN